MNIQNMVQTTGLSKRMIRHYEEVGLLKPHRNENNYRSYTPKDAERLQSIKALRHLGFSLENIGNILEQKGVEEILRKHLQELLFQKREDYLEQQRSIDKIKTILRSDNATTQLWNQIANLSMAPKEVHDGLDELLTRHKVVHGHIAELGEIAKKYTFGPHKDYHIESSQFMKFGDFFETTKASGASVVSCDELYTHFVLLTPDDNQYHRDFHEVIWAQFAQSWQKVSTVFAIHFETMTRNVAGLEHLYSWDDVAIRVLFRNQDNQEFSLALPYPPLHAFLRRDQGVYLRD